MKRLILAALMVSQSAQADPIEEVGEVRIQFRTSNHWTLTEQHRARALRDEAGNKYIVFNTKYLPDEHFEFWLRHELAHHIAWQRHGEDIQEHGPEFRSVCRKLIKKPVDQAKFCKRDYP